VRQFGDKRKTRRGIWKLAAAGIVVVCLPAGAATTERGAIEAIRREASAPASGSNGRALPLAAHWDSGEVAGGFSPDYQVQRIREGQYLLPAFRLPALNRKLPPDYYTAAARYCARNHLPISFLTPQWEGSLPDISRDYVRLDSRGQLLPLSPDAPQEPWRAVGKLWADHPAIRQVEALYPDPPSVLIVANNEYPKILKRSANGPDSEAQRREIGDAWISRYRGLLSGFRDNLGERAWRDRLTIIGYDAFAPPFIGRWAGWWDYSLYVPGRPSPWPQAWDGASVSYYLRAWTADSDHAVYSPQIEAMNLVPILAQLMKEKPAYWFELSVWDGQRLNPERFAGLTQFGMWLLRPRVVREFRNPSAGGVAKFGSYFDQTLAAVARVHESPLLERFWRHGQLLANDTESHPYSQALPSDFARTSRWFLLTSDANPPRPWKLDTPLRVFALALALPDQDQWLVYAFSPDESEIRSHIRIPGVPESLTIPARSSGAFTRVIREGTQLRTEPLSMM
jgi:hypothetical protein